MPIRLYTVVFICKKVLNAATFGSVPPMTCSGKDDKPPRVNWHLKMCNVSSQFPLRNLDPNTSYIQPLDFYKFSPNG